MKKKGEKKSANERGGGRKNGLLIFKRGGRGEKIERFAVWERGVPVIERKERKNGSTTNLLFVPLGKKGGRIHLTTKRFN